MPEFDFTGLGQAAQDAFKPHFVEVERRARWRRTRVAGASMLVVVLAVGVGVVSTYALSGGGERGLVEQAAGPGRTPDFIPSPGPSASPEPGKPGRPVRAGTLLAGDLRRLYLRYGDCQDQDCAVRLAATDDGGVNWRTSPIPVPNNSLVQLRVVGPRTLLAEVQTPHDAAAPGEQFWLSSTDGGANWQRVEITEVAVLPATFRPLEWVPGQDGVTVLAADPATGKIVRLATTVPLRSGLVVEGVPVSAGIWVTGYVDETVGPVEEPDGGVSPDKVTFTGSAIEVSHDGGRHWRRWILPEDLRASEGHGSAALAVHGNIAYVVGRVDGVLRIYRTDQDGNWRPTAAREQVGERIIEVGVRPDGTLLIQAGILAGENPIMFESVDQGETLREIEVGPGASAVAVPGGYAQPGNQDSRGAWTSVDGIDWSYVAPPAVD